ncbi:TPM domain-containing protein [Nitrospira calida]|jgi:putative membrane protein
MIRFSAEDLDKIRNAVRAAERTTRGEIVPMIVPASARYRDVGYRVGLASALLVLTVLLVVDSKWAPWGWHAANAGWLLFAVVGAYAMGQWAGTFPAVIRLFTSPERMAMKVRLRAEQAFYRHGLHKTKDRTGILILVSLLEHRVHVLADKGINDRVPPGTWDRIVAGLVDGIRAGRPTEALCEAIARCGEVLARFCPAGPGDNPNELSNELIQEA